MICPKCGEPLNANGYCETCDLTVTIYKKIKDRSKLLYNQGLQKAQVRDLSGAIDVLNRSVRLDKHNTDARNLLGLIYFELGETVTALGHWVISKNLKADNNEALYFLDKIQNNQSYLDKLNQAIKKYNQSLHYIQQGSVDLAIIQLKKVISLNDRFVKAYCLLALCYMKDEQKDKAKKILKKVIAIDKSNYVARKYQASLVEEESAVADFEEEQEEKTGFGLRPKAIKPNGTILQFISVATGVAIGLAIMGLMIMPGRLEEKDKEILALEQDIQGQNVVEESMALEQAGLEEAIEDLQEEISAYQANLEASQADQEAIADVVEAMDLYVNDETIAAARALYAIHTSQLPEDVLVVYERMTQAIYPSVGDEAYRVGKRDYDNNNLEEAIIYLQDAYSFNPTGDLADNALYFLGRSYQRLENGEAAIPVFEKVINEFPDSGFADDAQYRIDQIEG